MRLKGMVVLLIFLCVNVYVLIFLYVSEKGLNLPNIPNTKYSFQKKNVFIYIYIFIIPIVYFVLFRFSFQSVFSRLLM